MESVPAEFAPTTAERIARNQDLFRNANDKIGDSAEQYGYTAPVPFICECAEPTCRDIITVELSAYERVRANPRWFLTVPGHQTAARGYSEVVSEEGEYLIVEKTGRAGQVAEALDGQQQE